ncbi:MAG: hypothetical protein F4137_15870 [Acidobacteria bacterium]|nr:hypothetical protein [Acidobacteriota bacterium]MYH30286.1 hypothetical protein [Acidobacteriota bacterium]
MTKQNNAMCERWSPYGRRGAAGRMDNDAILVGDWLDKPAHDTRHVDLCAAYRALAQEGITDRLFRTGMNDLATSLAWYAHIEHLAAVHITFNDGGESVRLGAGGPPPAHKRLVEELWAELTLRKGNDPPRTMRVAADIAFIGERAEDGFVLGQSTGITAAEAANAAMEVFGYELELQAAANCEEKPQRDRHALEEEAVRIIEGNEAATLLRLSNAARRNIEPIMPAGRGVWIEIDAEGGINVGFR